MKNHSCKKIVVKTKLSILLSVILIMITVAMGCGGIDSSNDINDSDIIEHKLPDTGQTQSYTDTFGEDSDYAINLLSYTDNNDQTVTDKVTGLMWQQEDDETERTWDDANSYCDSLLLSEYSDWRLPTKKELVSIINLGMYNPAIDTTYFPNTKLSGYWSSTPHALVTDLAWYVDFDKGNVHSISKSYAYYVRCVRGEYLNFGNLTDNKNSTVTTNDTGVMWQQDESGTMDWESALTYCEGLSLAGFNDWRLPNYKEFESLTDETQYDPSIDSTYFPNAVSLNYWSSTTLTSGSGQAWYVHFGNDEIYYDNKLNDYHVRCVRGGQ